MTLKEFHKDQRIETEADWDNVMKGQNLVRKAREWRYGGWHLNINCPFSSWVVDRIENASFTESTDQFKARLKLVAAHNPNGRNTQATHGAVPRAVVWAPTMAHPHAYPHLYIPHYYPYSMFRPMMAPGGGNPMDVAWQMAQMMAPQFAHAFAQAKRGLDAINDGNNPTEGGHGPGPAKKMRVETAEVSTEAETKTDDRDKDDDGDKANSKLLYVVSYSGRNQKLQRLK
eukprot:scaffold5479_cov199-Amphora_coffeaeformis.AAC.15